MHRTGRTLARIRSPGLPVGSAEAVAGAGVSVFAGFGAVAGSGTADMMPANKHERRKRFESRHSTHTARNVAAKTSIPQRQQLGPASCALAVNPITALGSLLPEESPKSNKSRRRGKDLTGVNIHHLDGGSKRASRSGRTARHHRGRGGKDRRERAGRSGHAENYRAPKHGRRCREIELSQPLGDGSGHTCCPRICDSFSRCFSM